MKLLAIMGAGWLFLAATAHVPFRWTHTLGHGCSWRTRPAVAFLGRGSPDTAAARAERRCWARRGAHGPDGLPAIHTLLARFPAPAELAAMNGEAK